MDFFGIGIGEILLVLVVALIIWGPRRMPEIARTLGRMIRVLKKASLDLAAEATREVEEEGKDRPLQPEENSGDKTEKSSDVGGATLPPKDD